MSNLSVRIISAVIAIALLGVCLWLGSVGLYFLCLTASTLAFKEFFGLVRMPTAVSSVEFKILKLVFVLLGFCLFVFTSFFPQKLVITLPLTFVILAAVVSWFVARKENLNDVLPMLNMLFVGLIYCGLLPSVSVQIIALNPKIFLCHLAVVFGGDVCAYFVGRTMGNKKLHEALSPKKTVEGSLGGLLGSITLGFTVATWASLNLSVLTGILIFTVTGLFAQIGDLFESFLKRYANVKDSGSIMPGHGGVLDRLDGVLFSAPVFLLLFSLIN